jgi:hypothetical protein
MSADEERPGEFEQHARAVLDESVTRVSGGVRSRLNQARQAAIAESGSRPRSFWRLPALMPAAGAVAAAALVAAVLLNSVGGERGFPVGEAGQTAYEDIEMLSDHDGLELVENWDGSFYEWAAAAGEEGDSGASG